MEGNPIGKGRWLITSGAFISMSFLGMSRTFLGTALPAIRSSLDLNLVEAGTFPACLQFGFASAVFVGGFLSDVIKKKTMLMLGCLFMGMNLLIFGYSPWFWVNLIAMAIVGIGGGWIEASSDPLLIQLFPGRESMVMNFHHFFFAFGSLLGPVIVGALLARSIPWEWGYIGFGFFVIIIFFFFAFQKSPEALSTPKLNRKSVGGILSQRSFWILFFVTFCSMGVQNGIVFWMVTFLRETRGFSVAVASASLSTFFVCMALGRLLTGYLITKVQDATYLLWSFLFFLVSLYLCLTTPGNWSILFLGTCGFAQSGVFPVLIALTGKLYPEKPGTAMGFVATGAGLGAMSIPWLMALVSQLTSLQTGFFFLEIFVVSCLVLVSSHLRHFKAAARKPTP
jgi:MFS transporter, FHS family, glucose/mannose:H+ symporter